MSKKAELSLTDWNWAVLMMSQAMIGAISPNFRSVDLIFEGEFWVLRVTLRQESEFDREEIAEICDDFSVYLEDLRDRMSPQAYASVIPEVVVTQNALTPSPIVGARRIFQMRES